jgi:AraC-like DNA-binding protein
LQRGDNDQDETYFGFPSNTVFLTLTQDAKIIINKNDLTIENQPNDDVQSTLIVDNKKQGATTYRGKTNEITIYFKPLGINAFLEKPLSNYLTNTICDFHPFEEFYNTVKELFKLNDDNARMEFLENYFISKIKECEHPFLHKALERLASDTKPKISIAALAESLTISRTTLHKQFLLHIGTSPSQFIKIERFRNAVKMFAKSSTEEQLIDVVYLANYFDQSHMAKDFKSLTGYTPKVFFSKLSKTENSQLNWIFL